MKPMLQLKVCLVKSSQEKKRKYNFTPQKRAKIAKYALECGNTAADRHFSKEFPFLGEIL